MALEDFLNNSILEEDSLIYTILDVLELRAKNTPDETAFIYLLDGESKEVRISFLNLFQKANDIARALVKMNMIGERALMLYPPGPEFIFALYGCLYAGVVAVPAYPPRRNKSLDRIKAIVNDCEARITLTTQQVYKNSLNNFSEDEDLQQLQWMVSEEVETYDEIDLNPVRKGIDDLALLQYTSGSTGNPKGAMVSHKNICRNADFIRQSFELNADSVSVSWLPVFHDMGLIAHVFQTVYTGMISIIMPPVAFLQKPARWLKAISHFKGTFAGAPNFAFDMCVDNIPLDEKEKLDLSSLHTLYCGAEPIRNKTFKRFAKHFHSQGFKEVMLYPCYGMAETTLITTGGYATSLPVYLGVNPEKLKENRIVIAETEEEKPIYFVSVGYPWIDTEVSIVNPETFKKCQPDEVGEIWVKGSVVTMGYWNRPEETKDSFQAYLTDTGEGSFFRTGDLGFFRNNNLFIAGRIKDMIILRGRNYYPHDLEFVAEKAHEAIRLNNSAAFSVDFQDEEKLVLVTEIERTFMRDLDVESVCDEIRIAIFEEFEIEVHEIQLLRTASILKTSSGKIQRSACKQAYLRDSLNTVGISKLPDMKIEADSSNPDSMESILNWLKAWISFKFRVEYNSIDENRSIISYGLNSMKAVELQQHFLDTYKIDFPPYLFFDKNSVRELAERAYQLAVDSRQ